MQNNCGEIIFNQMAYTLIVLTMKKIVTLYHTMDSVNFLPTYSNDVVVTLGNKHYKKITKT